MFLITLIGYFPLSLIYNGIDNLSLPFLTLSIFSLYSKSFLFLSSSFFLKFLILIFESSYFPFTINLGTSQLKSLGKKNIFQVQNISLIYNLYQNLLQFDNI